MSSFEQHRKQHSHAQQERCQQIMLHLQQSIQESDKIKTASTTGNKDVFYLLQQELQSHPPHRCNRGIASLLKIKMDKTKKMSENPYEMLHSQQNPQKSDEIKTASTTGNEDVYLLQQELQSHPLHLRGRGIASLLKIKMDKTKKSPSPMLFPSSVGHNSAIPHQIHHPSINASQNYQPSTNAAGPIQPAQNRSLSEQAEQGIPQQQPPPPTDNAMFVCNIALPGRYCCLIVAVLILFFLSLLILAPLAVDMGTSNLRVCRPQGSIPWMVRKAQSEPNPAFLLPKTRPLFIAPRAVERPAFQLLGSCVARYVPMDCNE